MIGHRHRRHSHFDRSLHQFPHPHRPIQQRIFGVQMEMNEGIPGMIFNSVLNGEIFVRKFTGA